MSLAGIDIGSGSVKLSVYSYKGDCIASAGEKLTSRYPKPGFWEIDPNEVWEKTLRVICSVANMKNVKSDPPEVLAVSASGREIFPVNRSGNAIGPCIMAGDIREHGIKTAYELVPDQETWIQSCGHIPERMDPVCRFLWWRKNHPSVVSSSQYFIGWHEFLTLKLCGRAVTDRSLAGKWLIYNIKNHSWSEEYMALFGIRPNILPEIVNWGEIIGVIDNKLVEKAGLPGNIKVAVGGFDACCSALGAGVSDPGTGCLLSGTWENLIIPVSEPLTSMDLFKNGVFTGPYPGATSLALFALNPNGNSVVNWAGNVTKTDITKNDLSDNLAPSGILAIPQLTGSALPFGNNIRTKGSLIGFSLASSASDIIKSFKESIVFNLVLSMELIKRSGIQIKKLRAAGGGTRSEWWTQLKSDLLSLPVEVTNHDETGTAGAAILAGFAGGSFTDIKQGIDRVVRVSKLYEPNMNRLKAYKGKIAIYEETVNYLSVIADKLNSD